MTIVPASRARWMISSKAVLSTIEVISASGSRARAASILATCSGIEPSVCTKTIWQVAPILPQASSMPFWTACQNVLEALE
jgi:hypothetical protein